MGITSKLTRNFQITIPADIRKELSLKEGDVLAFGVKNGKIIAFPVQKVKETSAWREKEERADRDIKTGKIIGPFSDIEEAFRRLDEPVEE